jgi:hypothetical protein
MDGIRIKDTALLRIAQPSPFMAFVMNTEKVSKFSWLN